MQPVIVTESLAKVPRMDILWGILDRAGLSRVECNVVAAVPEDTKDVKRRHITAGREQLMHSLRKPSVVLLIGNTPLEAVTDKKGIKQRRGRPWEENGNIYLPCLPPGTAAYDERVLPQLEADLRLFVEIWKKREIPREDALDWTIVDTRAKFDAMLADLKGTISYDVETTGLNPWEGRYDVDENEWVITAKIVSIGFGTKGHQWCLPLNHDQATDFGLSHQDMMRHIDRRLRNCYLVAHNGKFDSLWLKVHYGLNWQVDFDTMLAHWVLDENQRHGLKLLAQLYFGAPNWDADLDLKQGTGGDLYKHCMYLAHDVYYTRRLRFHFGKMLSEDPAVERSFEKITMPIARLFVDIEYNGVLVDFDRFEEAEVYLRGELAKSLKDLNRELERAGGDPATFNWRSPKQLAEFFFDRLKLKVLDRTGAGAPSTNESVLKRLDHPAARALMKYRAADQMLKMFIDGWRPFLVKHADGWRLHPSFKLHGTVTGRASCEHPNLQQVPRESLIRSLIGAAKGWVLLEVDLSQIEMRISAELSGDETLLGIFDRDEDVHWMTAIKEITRGGGMAHEIIETARLHTGKKHSYGDAAKIVYDIGPDRAAELMPAWKELRKKAKAINFGYLFGMWWKKMMDYARDNYGVTLTEKQAQDSRKSFFDTYPRLAEWHERQRRYAKRNGYVSSLSGAKRRLPAAQSQHDTPERGEALRQAINSPVQRFACELNFMSLLQIVAEFGWDVVRPIGTVHDAILIEVREDMIEQVYHGSLEIMSQPSLLKDLGINLRVPIKGDAKVGPWSKGVSLEKFMAQNNLAKKVETIVKRKKVKA